MIGCTQTKLIFGEHNLVFGIGLVPQSHQFFAALADVLAVDDPAGEDARDVEPVAEDCVGTILDIQFAIQVLNVKNMTIVSTIVVSNFLEELSNSLCAQIPEAGWQSEMLLQGLLAQSFSERLSQAF